MIIFKRTADHPGETELEMRLPNDSSWPEVVESLLCFLRGCSYVIPNNVEIVVEEEPCVKCEAKDKD
jgi:hypothetical protein